MPQAILNSKRLIKNKNVITKLVFQQRGKP